MSNNNTQIQSATLFGHPTGLYTLFFAEMWERFSYYGMRALLLFYMTKGFLGYNDNKSIAVYGAYTALVYLTPFFGGMIADKLLGSRRAVVLGGLLMAAGHLMMTIQNSTAFFAALGLLITGNGFFKPNISTIVGSLYSEDSTRRDGGFTIFYMGINLGAALAPLLCGFIGQKYGWHYGFGLATIGMLTGTAVFVAPSISSQLLFGVLTAASAWSIFSEQTAQSESLRLWVNCGILAGVVIFGAYALLSLSKEKEESLLSVYLARIIILGGALAAAWALWKFRPDDFYSTTVNIFVAVAVAAAGIIAWLALGRGGLPVNAGEPADPERLKRTPLGISNEWLVYISPLIIIPLFSLFVSDFAMFHHGEPVSFVSAEYVKSIGARGGFSQVLAVLLRETSKPAGLILFVSGIAALIYLGFEILRLDRIARQRMYVVMILTFFSMLFWAFFEQAGTSINNFTDRNTNRMTAVDRMVQESDVGTTVTIEPTQAQLGYTNGEQMFTLNQLDALREAHKNSESDEPLTMTWKVAPDNVSMAISKDKHEIPASWFQSTNAVFILIFGLVFTAGWGFLAKRKLEPSTPVKFSLGLMQLGLGFGALWYGARVADHRGMVTVSWLVLAYLLHTTGELCLSPVGLSMITRLSPTFLVSTVMGMWFLATAFSQFLASIIAQFTGVGEGGEESAVIPAPIETLDLYSNVFFKIMVTAIISGFICLLLSPILKYWMHEHEPASSPVSSDPH